MGRLLPLKIPAAPYGRYPASGRNMNGKDYYEVLDIGFEATGKEIKEAYRRLAFQYHPDRNASDPDAVERMKSINEAYAVLSDPAKRQ